MLRTNLENWSHKFQKYDIYMTFHILVVSVIIVVVVGMVVEVVIVVLERISQFVDKEIWQEKKVTMLYNPLSP